MIYYVSVKGNDKNAGTAEAPFRTINHAAQIAVAGDTVKVHGGTYREWVDPRNGGRSTYCPIVYEAAEGEKPIIKGSEIVTDWTYVEDTVWKKTLPNTMFVDWNPYALTVEGDWYVCPQEYRVHLGDVYINGMSMYEAPSLEALYKAEKRTQGAFHNTAPYDKQEYIRYPEETVYQWYAEVDEKNTTVWCNFQKYDPNLELIEINVRKYCFYPSQTGINYITLRGFEIAHAATPWAPPTADQPGMVGPHWSKGWIIENNHLHDAKCCAISLGKEESTGHNFHSRFERKSGYQHQQEAVFKALQYGWNKDTIGSHTVRNNVIHDCGQCGIVGHLGCVFSRIEHNLIYTVNKKQEFWGHEVAGIKLHAAIDTVIENNNINNCNLGIWLDWEAQGTRVTKNLFYQNDRDLYLEITHGPCTVDNNLLLSRYSFVNKAQGTAFVHNLVTGFTDHRSDVGRSTPYHYPHSTGVAATAFVYGGDDRVMNNIVLADTPLPEGLDFLGFLGSQYNKYTTYDEYRWEIHRLGIVRDHDKFLEVPQAVYIDGNAYAREAKPFRKEERWVSAEGMRAVLFEDNGKWMLTVTANKAVADADCEAVTTERLGQTRITEGSYETPDGNPIDFKEDIVGNVREGAVIPGPFASLREGEQTLVIWEK